MSQYVGNNFFNQEQQAPMSPGQSNRRFWIILAVISLALILGFVAFLYWRSSQSSPLAMKEISDGSVTISDDQLTITLPPKFGTLESARSDKLDANGCNIESPVGFVCIKKDPAGGGVMFDVLAVERPSTLGALGDVAFLDFAVLKSTEGWSGKETTVSNQPFLGYESRTVTYKKSGTDRLSRSIFFIKDHKLYNFTFMARESTFNDLWSDIEQAIGDAKL